MYLYCLPFLLSIEQRIRFDSFSFTIAEISVVLIALMVLVRRRKGSSLSKDRAGPILLFMMAVASLPSILSSSDTHHAVSAYRDFVIPIVVLVGMFHIAPTEHTARRCIYAFVGISTAIAILGLVQVKLQGYQLDLPKSTLEWQVFKTTLIRTSLLGRLLNVQNVLPTGLCIQTNNYACYLTLPTVLAAALVRSSRTVRVKLLFGTSLAIQAATLILTFSRTSIFATLIGSSAAVCLAGNKSQRRGSLLITTMAICVSLALIGGMLPYYSFDGFGTVQGRIGLAQAAFEVISTTPLVLVLGGGTERFFGIFDLTEVVHNAILFGILQYGVVAISLWLIIVSRAWFFLLKAWSRETGPHRSVLAGIVCSTGVTLWLFAQTTSFIDSCQMALWLTVWMGLGAQLVLGSPRSRTQYARRVEGYQGSVGRPDIVFR